MNNDQSKAKEQQGDLQQNNALNDEYNELLDDEYEEETAAEIMDNEDTIFTERSNEDDSLNIMESVYGWIAVVLSVLSFFIAPYVFAGAAIILGFFARTRERVMLGNIAIVVGIISIITRFLFFTIM